jgi:hypothetical protein
MSSPVNSTTVNHPGALASSFDFGSPETGRPSRTISNSHRDRPLASIATPLQQHPPGVVDGQHPGRRNQAVRLGSGGVVQVLGPAHGHTSSPVHGLALSHTRPGELM